MQFEAADSPLLKKREVKKVTLLAVTGDRGLCGGYNTNVIKQTEQRYQELQRQGFETNLVLIGR